MTGNATFAGEPPLDNRGRGGCIAPTTVRGTLDAGKYLAPEWWVARRILHGHDELRVFVDDTGGMGHQSSTLHLIERLVFEFGYRGQLTVVYKEGGSGVDDTLAKLRVIGPRARATAHARVRLGDATLRWIPFRDRARLSPVGLGITGGADGNGAPNLATEVRAATFMRLQPYLWPFQLDLLERLGDSSPRAMSTSDLAGTHFWRRAYHVHEARPGSQVDWESAGAFSQPSRVRVEALKLITTAVQNGELLMTAMYGIRGYPLNAAPEDVVALYLAALRHASGYFPMRAVIVNFDVPLSLRADLLEPILRGDEIGPRVDAETALAGNRKATGAAQLVPAEQRAAAAVERAHFMRVARMGACVRIVGPVGDARAVRDGLKWLATRRFGVLLVQLGSVPRPFYAKTFGLSTLPAIFEGQATASIALNAARPFLQLRPAGVGSVPRRDAVSPDDSAAATFACLAEAAEALVSGSRGARPFCEVLNALSGFLAAAASNVESELSRDIASVYRRYAGPDCDKLVRGLAALERTNIY
jgi:hypothetical protein